MQRDLVIRAQDGDIATHGPVKPGAVIEPRLDVWPDPYRLDWSPDGTGVRRLSRVRDDGQFAFFKAEWSPDGAAVVTQASSPHGDAWTILIIAVEGTGELDIGAGIIPKWSPDGDWVAFYGDGGMTVVGRDGRDARVLEIGDDKEVVWSPDGTALGSPGVT